MAHAQERAAAGSPVILQHEAVPAVTKVRP